MNETILFKETQQFRQPLLWLILIIVLVIVVGTTGSLGIRFLFLNKPPKTGQGIVLLLAALVAIGIGSVMFSAKLEVEVRTSGLYLRFFPFHFSFNQISLNNLEKHEVITYSAFKDYGGWGIRYGRNGKAYIVSGNTGVRLDFKDAEALCIGSQKAEELNKALDQITH